MESNGRQKKMRWRQSIICWRGGGRNRQNKRDLELESAQHNRRNPVVAAFEEHEYRKPRYLEQHPYHFQYADSVKKYNYKPRSIARPISTKRTSSASTGHTTETRSTHGDSTESPSFARTRQSSRSSPQRARPSQASQSQQEGIRKRLSRSPSAKKKRSTQKTSTRGVANSNNDVYVAIKHDNETITELSTPDMEFEEDEDYTEADSRLSNGYASRSMRSSMDYSDINGFSSYQPDGVLEATILRSDSDSTRDMSILGAEAHVSVYNLSERMSYDLREAGRNISTLASQVAHACIVNPKLIKK